MTDVTSQMVQDVRMRAREEIESGHPGHPEDIVRESAQEVVEARFPDELPRREEKQLLDELVRRAGVPSSDYGEFGPL